MAQCLRIRFLSTASDNFLHNCVQKTAKKLSLEGTAQVDNNTILIVVCGVKDAINQFVDVIHKEISKKSAEDFEIEPFIKEKDYRGVFRIIE
jgi:acylphosphatase